MVAVEKRGRRARPWGGSGRGQGGRVRADIGTEGGGGVGDKGGFGHLFPPPPSRDRAGARAGASTGACRWARGGKAAGSAGRVARQGEREREARVRVGARLGLGFVLGLRGEREGVDGVWGQGEGSHV